MNIGIFTDTYYPIINGVSTSVMMLDKELTKLGHKVYIFAPSVPNATKDPHVFRLPSMPFVFMPTNRMALMYSPSLLLKLKKFHLDIIHTQTEFPLGIFGKLTAEFYKIPLVHTYHTMYEDYVHYIAKGHLISRKMARKYSRIFCNRAVAVIAPAEKTREKLLIYGVKRPIYTIPTGIDFEPFSPDNFSKEEIEALKTELGVGLDVPVIISIGRLAKEKSVDVLIRQMPEILKKKPELKLVIVGDGGYKKELVSFAESLNVQDSIVFAGEKPWKTIGKYYQLGDIFVCASTSESQGLTYLEAMAAKVPVIVKKDKSVEGIVIDGTTGLYFENDYDAADIICNALDNMDNMKNIADNAYASVQSLSSAEFGKNAEQLYIDILSMVADTKGIKRSEKQEKKDKKDKKDKKEIIEKKIVEKKNNKLEKQRKEKIKKDYEQENAPASSKAAKLKFLEIKRLANFIKPNKS